MASFQILTSTGSIWAARVFVATTLLAPAPICFALLLGSVRREPRWSLRTWMALVGYVAVDMALVSTLMTTRSPLVLMIFMMLNAFPAMAFVLAFVVRLVRQDLHDPRTLY
jgi:hypothetical protein